MRLRSFLAAGPMLFPPIIERELRAALHRRGTIQSRFRMARLGVLVVSVFLLLSWLLGQRSLGGTLHFILFIWGLFLAIGPAMNISVGLFSEERRNQTLELLYLAGMSSGELFGGKLVGAVLMASCDLLALFPLMALPFLLGGVSVNLFLATLACFPTLLLFMLAAGLLASVMCKDDGAAMVLAIVLVGVVTLALPLPYTLGQFLTGAPPFSSHWLSLSPALGPYLVWKHFAGFAPRDYWASTEFTLAWSAIFLTLAAVLLKRNWRRDLEHAAAPTGWSSRWESLVHGGAAWRAGLRRRILADNPFQWLSQQDRRTVMLAWAFITGMCLLWLTGWHAWPRFWLGSMNLYSAAFLFILGIKWLQNYSAARRIGEDRRDGVLELLLTTPLSPQQIVEGQVAAVRAQFLPVRLALFGLFVLMMTAGFLARKWNTQAAITYFLIWCLFFFWCLASGRWATPKTMWISLNSGRPVFAAFGSLQAFRYNWFWILFNLRNISRGFGRSANGFPRGTEGEFIILCFLVLGLIVGLIITWAARRDRDFDMLRQRLITEMRSIAREPVPDPKDPRFKQWKNLTERFPTSPNQPQFPPLPHPFNKQQHLG